MCVSAPTIPKMASKKMPNDAITKGPKSPQNLHREIGMCVCACVCDALCVKNDPETKVVGVFMCATGSYPDAFHAGVGGPKRGSVGDRRHSESQTPFLSCGSRWRMRQEWHGIKSAHVATDAVSPPWFTETQKTCRPRKHTRHILVVSTRCNFTSDHVIMKGLFCSQQTKLCPPICVCYSLYLK